MKKTKRKPDIKQLGSPEKFATVSTEFRTRSIFGYAPLYLTTT